MAEQKQKIIRCAVYTRKSTEEGLEMEFNSLDAQREAAENFIHSQKHEGWRLLIERYDDGGYTGGNMDRPALEKLIRDIELDRVDCVVVYKVDRLSRSLLDFASLIDTFDRHHVTFVSVTQAFNTTTSMGRLTLNILLSFAQFEREIIGERIRDKIAAAKKKGKHTGGMPILGYDIENSKLVVNQKESKTVRDIFRRFLVLRSPLTLAKELNKRGIPTKKWTTKKGKVHKGADWNKSNIYKLLNNRKYIGEVTHHGTIYRGEHDAIIDLKTWERVQALFKENGHTRANSTRTRIPAILKGLLDCGHCGGALGITYSRKNGKNYHYYQCISASKNGFDSCTVRRVPAADIETAVVRQLRHLLRAPETLAMAHRAFAEEQTKNLDSVDGEKVDLPEQKEFAQALADIEAVWEHLFPAEQARICHLLIDKIIVHPDAIDMRLRTCGLNALSAELSQPENEEMA